MGEPPSRLDRYTFLIERPLGKRVALALRENGFRVKMFTDHFLDGAPDVEWISRAANEGWVVLTKDSAIRRRPNERLAIQNSGLRVFTLTRGTWTADDMAHAFIAAGRRIAKTLKLHPGPFIARITKTGEISKMDDLAGREEEDDPA